MSASYEVYTDLRQLREFLEGLGRDMVEEGREFHKRLTVEAINGVRAAAIDRMPSGGGSFVDSIFSVDVVDEPHHMITDVKSSHPWAYAVEFGTAAHSIPLVGSRVQHIREVLPIRGGGQTEPVSPPYGTRYGMTDIRVTRVEHPGARPFHVFRDTAAALDGALNRMIDYMLSKVGFR